MTHERSSGVPGPLALCSLSGNNAAALRDPWEYESDTAGIRMAQAIGTRESNKTASGPVQPFKRMDTDYRVPAAYLGVWATKKEIPGGRECALPAQPFDAKPWIYPKPIPTHFIRTA